MSRKLTHKYQKERQFGWLIAGFILSVCLYRHLKTGHTAVYAPAVAGVLFLLSLIRPAILYYPLLLWEKLAYYLALINTVLLLSIVYLLVFLPLGLLLRLTRRDLLGIRMNKAKTSYWETREKATASVKHQF
jgi:hypothetical protein